MRSVRQSAQVGADIVRPQEDGQKAFPETQMQIPDGEEPCATPRHSHEGVLLDLNPLRMLALVVCQDLLRGPSAPRFITLGGGVDIVISRVIEDMVLPAMENEMNSCAFSCLSRGQ